MRLIPLTGKYGKGQFAIVDDDFDESKFERVGNWYVTNGYAATRIKGRERAVFLHRLIVSPPAGMVTDHKNRNKLDNRRSNLRICTQSQNIANRSPHMPNKTGYKGVTWVKRWNRWRAYIVVKSRYIYLGHFDTREQAAEAYNEAALKYFGEYAVLNKIAIDKA